MSDKNFEKFKKTGSVEDYLYYIKNKKKDAEMALEKENGVKRRDNNKNNQIPRKF